MELACERTMRQIVAFSKQSGEPIEGISASGHGPSLIVIDKAGNPGAEIVTWQNSSNTSEAQELSAVFPGFRKTGECWEAKVVSAWRSCKEVWNGTTALYPKDYFLFLLCGRRVIDKSTASTIAFFNRELCCWNSEPIMIDPRFLPNVVSSWEEIGKTGTDFSRLCGLKDGVPIYGGGIDAWCEALGAGATVPGMLVDGSGTSTCVSICLGKDQSILEHVIPHRSFRIETISYTGGSAEWAADVFNYPIQKWKNNCAYEKPIPILFLPYLIGERSPVWDVKASAAFVGMHREHRASDLMTAVFQGTAFAVAECLALIESAEGIEAVRAVGGGADNIPWMQIKASVTGKVYEVMQEKKAAPLGSAMIAAYGAGAGSFDDLVERYVRVEREIEPDMRHRSAYVRLMDSYGRLYQSLKREMELLANERSSVCDD
jgi:xylulokinase